MRASFDCKEGDFVNIDCPNGGSLTVEDKEGRLLTVDCDDTSAEIKAEKKGKKSRRSKRHVSDELAKDWVRRWRTYNTNFSVMAEEDGFTPLSVAYNVYKNCTFQSDTELKQLKEELENSRALVKKLQHRVEVLEEYISESGNFPADIFVVIGD